jgi:hypothetical protein
VIGLYISYATPIFLRITVGRHIKPGPFTLGRWYLPIGIIAVAWVSFITLVLLFPSYRHPSASEMSESYTISSRIWTKNQIYSKDYTVVIIMGVFLFASVSWVLSARKWFTGPVSNLNDSNTMSIEKVEKVRDVFSTEVHMVDAP